MCEDNCMSIVPSHDIDAHSITTIKTVFAIVCCFFICHELFDTYNTKMEITLHVAHMDMMIKCICVRLCM
jgi:hypothetical protein